MTVSIAGTPSKNIKYTYTASLVGTDLTMRAQITDTQGTKRFALDLTYHCSYPPPAGAVDTVELRCIVAPFTAPTVYSFFTHPVLTTVNAGTGSFDGTKTTLYTPTTQFVCVWQHLRNGVEMAPLASWGNVSGGLVGTTQIASVVYGSLLDRLTG